jgi:hypothetical protein
VPVLPGLPLWRGLPVCAPTRSGRTAPAVLPGRSGTSAAGAVRPLRSCAGVRRAGVLPAAAPVADGVPSRRNAAATAAGARSDVAGARRAALARAGELSARAGRVPAAHGARLPAAGNGSASRRTDVCARAAARVRAATSGTTAAAGRPGVPARPTAAAAPDERPGPQPSREHAPAAVVRQLAEAAVHLLPVGPLQERVGRPGPAFYA